jgi:pimeloyl-ACP methyl ester carboxylesterase
VIDVLHAFRRFGERSWHRLQELQQAREVLQKPIDWGENPVGDEGVIRDVRDKLHQIQCPIFLFKGEADYHIPEQAVMETLAGIPNGLGEGGIAKGMGHLIMMEQPEQLAEACLAFLRRRQIIA